LHSYRFDWAMKSECWMCPDWRWIHSVMCFQELCSELPPNSLPKAAQTIMLFWLS